MRLDVPLHDDEENEKAEEPQSGRGLCLSGGGYRAMLFHLGVLWRLNEFRMLPTLDRVSSVSGGSMLAALLGLRWSKLKFHDEEATNFAEEIVSPIRKLASRTLDVSSVVGGVIVPGKSINEVFADALAKHLYGDASLQDLPDSPLFVINATNLQTGKLWRFSRPYMGDWTIGRILKPQVSLAKAVAASAAFPPVLSPAKLRVNPKDFVEKDASHNTKPAFMNEIVLADGGVYDNVGLETVFKKCRTVLVSDAGMMASGDPEVGRGPIEQMIRVYQVADAQVRALRKRQLLAGLKAKPPLRDGAYWSSNSSIVKFPAENTLPCPIDSTRELATLPTRLEAMPEETQERLINWGYAICDAGIRGHVDASLPAPSGFPFSRGV